jgi:ferredoxin
MTELATRLFEVRIGDATLRARAGQRLIELCDAHITPLNFGCRAGSCGACLIRVDAGMENLSGVTDVEEILLPELTDDPNARLACQVSLAGPVTLVPLG